MNLSKSTIIILLVIVFCVIITIVLTLKEQSQEKQDAYVPCSHITVQMALEKGEHLYKRDSITGEMIHSQDCPNSLK